MGFTRVPSVGRWVALLVIVTVTASLGVVTGSPATAATSTLSVSYRQSGTNAVTVSGRTVTASPKVRFQRYTGSGWAFVKRVRAHRHRYSTTLSVPAGATRKFRVTSDHRSRTFTVRMSAAKLPTLYDDCGARPRKPDGTAWSCTFHDDFSGTTLDRTKWVPQTVFADGAPAAYTCYRDNPANVNVSGGALNLTLVKLDAPAPCGRPDLPATPYQSGSVSTYHLFSQQYGRFQARVRTTASSVPGLHEAFWLWPDDRVPSTTTWPTAGEIDVVETYSVQPTLAVPFLHYSADAGGPQPGLNTAWNCTAYRGQWNTYTLEWGPSRLAIYVNGRTCLVNTSGDPAFRKPYIVAFTQGLGMNTNTLTASTPLPATTSVDYLRVWK